MVYNRESWRGKVPSRHNWKCSENGNHFSRSYADEADIGMINQKRTEIRIVSVIVTVKKYAENNWKYFTL